MQQPREIATDAPYAGSRLLVGAYLIASIIALLSGIFRPDYNWDLIPYVAAATEHATDSPAVMHAALHRELEQRSGTFLLAKPPPGLDNPFRALMRNDPAAFHEHLDFYRVRVIYIGLIRLLAATGMSPVFATHFISALSIALSIQILLLIGRRRLSTSSRFILLPIALGLGMLETARLSTPDGLACLVTLTAVYLLLAGNRALYLLLPMMVAIRTDLLLLVVLFAGAMYMGRDERFRPAPIILSLLLSITLLLFLESYFAYPGWKALFYFTFVDRMALASPPPFGPGVYLRVLARGGWSAFNSAEFLFFIGLATMAYTYWRRSPRWRSDGLLLLVVALLYIALRLIAFPLPDARFLVGLYVTTAIAAFLLISEAKRAEVNVAESGI
jgi:hypothetical protein